MSKENKHENKTLAELRAERDAAVAAYNAAETAQRKLEQEEAERKKVEMARHKEERRKLIEEKEEELNKLYYAYFKDYGEVAIKRTRCDDDDSLVSLLLKHNFIF